MQHKNESSTPLKRPRAKRAFLPSPSPTSGGDVESSLKPDPELAALKNAIESRVHSADLLCCLEVFVKAAAGEDSIVDDQYVLRGDPAPASRGIAALLVYTAQHGWSRDRSTSLAIRVRCIMDVLLKHEWIAIQFIQMSEDHAEFYVDPRLAEIGVTAPLHFDLATETSWFDADDFVSRLLTLITH